MVPRFGTDGIRGAANSELTPELALALGRAAARHLDGTPFLVGRDTRQSGPVLQAALSAGLSASGRDVLDVGVIPTPGLAFLAASRRLPAAMISASHNPFEDNGIKLLGLGGTKLDLGTERAIELDLHAPGPDPATAGSDLGSPPAALGRLDAEPGAITGYVDHLVDRMQGATMPDGLVVVDCANGAASAVAPVVLDRLGVRNEVLFASPDGTNINAGCGSTHLGALAHEVVKAGAALGIAFDGDADRMLAVDHRGEPVDGDQLIAMFARDLHGRGLLTGGTVVVTVLSNLGLRHGLAAAGIGVIETPVGDRHVSDALEAGGLALGGEQSGHLIFRHHAPTGDGLLTALLLLELLGRTGATLADSADIAMHRLPQLLHNVPVADPSRLVLADAVWDEVAAVEAELGETGRVLLRPSGTESCVRVMVEAATHEEAEQLAARLSAAVARELADDSALA
jgi:phosphoglucosamine mutase